MKKLTYVSFLRNQNELSIDFFGSDNVAAEQLSDAIEKMKKLPFKITDTTAAYSLMQTLMEVAERKSMSPLYKNNTFYQVYSLLVEEDIFASTINEINSKLDAMIPKNQPVNQTQTKSSAVAQW